MKVLTTLVLLLLLTVTGAHAQRLHGVEQFLVEAPPGILALATSPCDDSLFVTLKARPAESWTASERAYVERLSVECGAARAADTTTAAGLGTAGAPAHRPAPSLLPVIGVALAALLIYLVIHSSIKPDLSGIGPILGSGPAAVVPPVGASGAAPPH
ncbi:MAG: hypothetical protein K8R56_05430 [Candidatus Eisenbacteria bacterium]|nr:hypothetical protein [Candidatus Eisenbacteria bacterium]